MKIIKKLMLYFYVMLALMNILPANSVEFTKVMQDFKVNFENFAQAYHSSDKNKKQQLYGLAIKSLNSCGSLYSYVQKHPHEKRSVPKEERDEIEKILHGLPQPTEQQKKDLADQQRQFNSLLKDFINRSKSVPRNYKHKKYSSYLTSALTSFSKIQKFVKKYPGIFMFESQKQQIIDALDKLLKSLPKKSTSFKRIN